VISLLSSDTPNLDSPANVDAAKEVRTDLAGQLCPKFSNVGLITMKYSLQEKSPAIGEAERRMFLGRLYLAFFFSLWVIMLDVFSYLNFILRLLLCDIISYPRIPCIQLVIRLLTCADNVRS
jgi:hypothetical protein